MTEYGHFENRRPAFSNRLASSKALPRHSPPRAGEWPGERERPAKAHGEAALWAAVITQALMDALHRPTTAEATYFKHEATVWLTENNRDFRMVCECAGFDPGYVRRMAKRALTSPRKWRADPGHGPRYLERRESRQRIKEEKSCLAPGTRYLEQNLTTYQVPGTAYALA